LHDAMVKPMPGVPLAPSLAESWTVSKDGLTYEFVLRKGAKFHNGDPVTAEDVKFSLERYRGASGQSLQENVAAVDTPDPGRGRGAVPDPRGARRGAPAAAGAHAEAGGDPGPAMGQRARPVGSEIAVARPPRAAGRQLRDQPAGDQRGHHPRALRADV